MSSNVTCVNFVRYPSPGSYPYFIGNYVFIFVFVIGLLGNVLNLIVLNRMNIKCKCFLSSMALSDLFFFLSMFVLNLSVYDCLALSTTFMKFYYKSKVTLVVLANWFSSASIWFAIMVTVERLVAIRTPIRARTFWTPNRLITIIVVIFLFTVLFQIPHYLWYEPSAIPDCKNLNNTIPVLMQLSQSHKYYKLVKIAITICPMIIVTIPLILLISFNSLLLYHLRLSRKYVCEFETFPNQRSKDNERQITIMICVIVGTFFVFNFPSAVVFICSVFEKDAQKIVQLVTTSLATNYMVTLHKMFNFPLYCCSSSNFRKNLKRVFRGMLRKASGHWANDTPTSNSVVNSFKSKSAGFGRQSLMSNRKFVEIPINVEQMRLL